MQVQDIDQVFGDLSRWIRTKLRYAQGLEDFRKSLHCFLQQLPRQHERDRMCLIVSQVRDWKSYLAHLGKTITGIAGPTAPRVFDFVQRGAYDAGHPIRVHGHGRKDDCILRLSEQNIFIEFGKSKRL